MPMHWIFGISLKAVQGVRVYQKKGAYNRWTKWTPKKERMHTIGCIWLCVSDTKDTPKKERPGQLDQGAYARCVLLALHRFIGRTQSGGSLAQHKLIP